MDNLQDRIRIRLCSRRDRNDRRGFHPRFHDHPFFELAWVEAGSCLWTLEPHRTFLLKTGQCLLLPPYTRHREDMEGAPGQGISWIGFDLPGGEEMLRSLSFKRIQVQNLSPEMLFLYRCVEREWSSELAEAQGMAAYALAMILVHLRRSIVRRRSSVKARGGLNDRQTRIVLAATSYFEQNPSLPRSVEQAARIQSLSVSHFSALFRKWHGVGPRDYVQQMRVRRACDSLIDPELSIKEIAAANGYVDAAHFCRHFRKETGQTPTAYRESRIRRSSK